MGVKSPYFKHPAGSKPAGCCPKLKKGQKRREERGVGMQFKTLMKGGDKGEEKTEGQRLDVNFKKRGS